MKKERENLKKKEAEKGELREKKRSKGRIRRRKKETKNFLFLLIAS